MAYFAYRRINLRRYNKSVDDLNRALKNGAASFISVVWREEIDGLIIILAFYVVSDNCFCVKEMRYIDKRDLLKNL